MCELSSPLTEATDGGLKLLLGLMVKCSCLEVAGFCSSRSGLLSPWHHLDLLSWLYDLAYWHLGFLNSPDVFPGRGC